MPAYLHWPLGQPLRNCRLAKRDVEQAIREFWKFYYAARRGEKEQEGRGWVEARTTMAS